MTKLRIIKNNVLLNYVVAVDAADVVDVDAAEEKDFDGAACEDEVEEEEEEDDEEKEEDPQHSVEQIYLNLDNLSA